jgi:hypothetical protein
MSSTIAMPNADEMLALIGSLETQLATLKIALGATGVTVPAKPRSKSAKPADGAPKAPKAPNAWIVFSSKVSEVLKAASIATGAATVSKQFASSLKDIKPYAEWTDEAIVEAWSTWEKPEQSKSGKAKAESAAASASESGSESAAEGGAAAAAPAPKARKPQSEETKKAAAAKRAATKAAKAAAAAAGGAPSAPSSADASADASEAEEEAVTAAVTAAVPAPIPAAPPSPPKSTAKKVGAKAYTIGQLADFEDEVVIEGENYGRNIRGDMVDSDFNFVGRWDAKSKKLDRSAAKPADWEAIYTAAQQ